MVRLSAPGVLPHQHSDAHLRADPFRPSPEFCSSRRPLAARRLPARTPTIWGQTGDAAAAFHSSLSLAPALQPSRLPLHAGGGADRGRAVALRDGRRPAQPAGLRVCRRSRRDRVPDLLRGLAAPRDPGRLVGCAVAVEPWQRLNRPSRARCHGRPVRGHDGAPPRPLRHPPAHRHVPRGGGVLTLGAKPRPRLPGI